MSNATKMIAKRHADKIYNDTLFDPMNRLHLFLYYYNTSGSPRDLTLLNDAKHVLRRHYSLAIKRIDKYVTHGEQAPFYAALYSKVLTEHLLYCGEVETGDTRPFGIVTACPV